MARWHYELHLVLRGPAVAATPWLGNDLSAKAVGKFNWGFLVVSFVVSSFFGIWNAERWRMER